MSDLHRRSFSNVSGHSRSDIPGLVVHHLQRPTSNIDEHMDSSVEDASENAINEMAHLHPSVASQTLISGLTVPQYRAPGPASTLLRQDTIPATPPPNPTTHLGLSSSEYLYGSTAERPDSASTKISAQTGESDADGNNHLSTMLKLYLQRQDESNASMLRILTNLQLNQQQFHRESTNQFQHQKDLQMEIKNYFVRQEGLQKAVIAGQERNEALMKEVLERQAYFPIARVLILTYDS